MSRKFGLATTGYFVATMVVAVIWHLVLFHDKYVEMGAMTRIDPIMPFGMAAVMIQGLVFAYFYSLFCRHEGGGHPVSRGIQFSLLLGLNVWTVMVLATVAKFDIAPIFDFVALGTAFQILQFVAVGAVIGWIYGEHPLEQ